MILNWIAITLAFVAFVANVYLYGLQKQFANLVLAIGMFVLMVGNIVALVGKYQGF